MENIKRGRKRKKMGNPLPLACSKRRQPSELLDEGGARIPVRTSSRRNKRTKATATAKETKRRATEDTTPACSVSAEVEIPDGDTDRKSKRRRHKADDKSRQSDTGAKGKDRTPRRSATELGIEWIGDFCPDGNPHVLIDIHRLDGGGLFKCSRCKKHLWLPMVLNEAAILDSLIDMYGARAGYGKYLDKHREAKVLVAKLQDLWYARQRITDNEEFMMLVITVMEDKEYDRKDNQVEKK